MRTSISIRIPDDLASKLSEISSETERPKSFHVQKARVPFLLRARLTGGSFNLMHRCWESQTIQRSKV